MIFGSLQAYRLPTDCLVCKCVCVSVCLCICVLAQAFGSASRLRTGAMAGAAQSPRSLHPALRHAPLQHARHPLQQVRFADGGAPGQPSGPAPHRRRPRRTAAARRAPRCRAEARMAERLLHGLQELDNHRGCRLSPMGAALRDAFCGATGGSTAARPERRPGAASSAPRDYTQEEKQPIIAGCSSRSTCSPLPMRRRISRTVAFQEILEETHQRFREQSRQLAAEGVDELRARHAEGQALRRS